MLLALPVSWAPAGDASFDVTLEDCGHQVTARVFTDERGAPVDVSTDDRWRDLPGGPVRTRWSTPVAGWTDVDGRRLPARGSAIWHLPEGPFTYAEFRFSPGDVRYNVVPAKLSAAAWASPQARLVAAAERVRNWGATGQEQDLALPGDELVAGPASVATRAVTVAAAPEEVWRWLVQIGQDRGGMYSYDWLENALGLRIHSTGRIREEWQRLDPGDQVRLVPKGWLGLKDGFALPVARGGPRPGHRAA